MPDQFTAALKEYLLAKVEQRAPEVTIAKEGGPRATGHQHHGRDQEERAGEGPDEGARGSWKTHWASSAQAGHASGRHDQAKLSGHHV